MYTKSAALQDIPEPEDDEIRAVARGLPVLIIRPEDIAGFKPSIFDVYSQSEILKRKRAIESLALKFNPLWRAAPSSYWDGPAITRSAFAGGCFINNKPQSFLVIRHSRQVSPIQALSNITGLGIKDLKASRYLQKAMHALYAWHETGHIKASIEKRAFKNNFEEELYAERFAIGKVAGHDDSQEAIRDHVLTRALAGFLDQPPEYWLAPVLSQQFNQAASGTDTWSSYAELRLRSVASITGNSLEGIPSKPVHQALHLWRNGEAFRIRDQNLSYMVQCFDEVRTGKNYADSGRTKRKMLLALPEILQSPLIDPFTKAAGNQIIEAVHTFCPRISAEMTRPKRSLLGWLFS